MNSLGLDVFLELFLESLLLSAFQRDILLFEVFEGRLQHFQGTSEVVVVHQLVEDRRPLSSLEVPRHRHVPDFLTIKTGWYCICAIEGKPARPFLTVVFA